MKILPGKTFETVGTIRLDNTAYGNRYWMQFEESDEEDQKELDQWGGKRRRVTVMIHDLTQEQYEKGEIP